jgi:hypothetical protein
LYPELSDRSLARLVKSFRIIVPIFGLDFWPQAVERFTRPNGGLNIAALERTATWIADSPDRWNQLVDQL